MSRIRSEQVRCLNEPEASTDGVVIYWMRFAHRVEDNPALDFAINKANERGEDLAVIYSVSQPKRKLQKRFWEDSMDDLISSFRRRKISFFLTKHKAQTALKKLQKTISLVVTDSYYHRDAMEAVSELAKTLERPVFEVETDCIIPPREVSDKKEFAARTIRKKVNSKRRSFLKARRASHYKGKGRVELKLAARIDWKRSTRKIKDPLFLGGEKAAKKRLRAFLRNGLKGYAKGRSDPLQNHDSRLSPYLRWGMLSPVDVAVKVQRSKSASKRDKEAFLEELIVRRELARNFCLYEKEYDQFSALPDWAFKTLKKHQKDNRQETYSKKNLEAAKTDDPLWNACMKSMKKHGYLHNQLRMYWGKKFLDYYSNPKTAHRDLLDLNNKYFLDGNDPNSFVNVLWCFGLHDRAFQEGQVRGKVRPFTQKAIERKTDLTQLINHLNS